MATNGTCPTCGDEFEVPSHGKGTFITITVSFHDDDREDWSDSFCPDCADAVLAEVER